MIDRHIRDAMGKFGVNTPLRKAHFLAQIDHESNGFRAMRENLNYSVEALLRAFPKRISPDEARRHGRTATQPANQEAIANAIYGGEWGAKNLGNTAPGDGWRFIGRGLIQITGRANYVEVAKVLGLGGRLIGNPQLLESPELAAHSAGWYWKSRGLNAFADRDDVVEITRRINGGRNGLEHRKELLDKYKADLGVA